VIELLQAGAHAEAFALLLPRYEGKIYRLCCTLMRDPIQAQDAAQESLVRIWRVLSRYDARASLSTWMYAITRNRCLSAIERRRDLASLSDAAIESEVEALREAADEGGEDDQSALLRGLVDELPERFRRILMLFYYEDRAVSEVAEMLGTAEGTVKATLFRARAALSEQLRRRGLDDPRSWLSP